MSQIIFNDKYSHEIFDSSTSECIQIRFTSTVDMSDFLDHLINKGEVKYTIDINGVKKQCSAVYGSMTTSDNEGNIDANVYMREKSALEKLEDRVTALEQKVDQLISQLEDVVGVAK